MSAEQVLKFYDRQANAAERLERALGRATDGLEVLAWGVNQVVSGLDRMAQALEIAAKRLGAVPEASAKTEKTTGALNSPVEELVKSMASVGGEEGGLKALGNQLNPANLTEKNLLIPLAINVVWSLFGQDILKLLEPAMVVLEAFAGLVRGALGTLAPVFTLACQAAGGLVSALGWLGGQLDVLMPLALGFGAAFAAFQIAAHWTKITGLYTKIATAVTAAYHFVVNLLTIGFGMLRGSTVAASAATFTFNSALLASPVTWVVMAVLLLIGALYAGVAAFNKLTGSAVSATGIICGAFAVLGAYALNNTLIPLQRGFASFVNFLGNVFHNPVGAIKVAFCDMALTVLGYLKTMAAGLEGLVNKIPGISFDMTSGLDGLYARVEEISAKAKTEGEWVEYVKAWDHIDYGDAARAGYDFGEKVQEKIGGFFSGATIPGMEELQSDTAQTAANTGVMVREVNIADEDLQFLRDVAEMRYIQNFVTLSPSVAMNASISERVDVGTVVREIGRQLEEEFAASAQGVFV